MAVEEANKLLLCCYQYYYHFDYGLGCGGIFPFPNH
jgi:hypothetical protein